MNSDEKVLLMGVWESKIWGIVLWPLSVLYGCGVRFRNGLYDGKVLPSVRLEAKVISVGNITVGGTGKTPLVERLARHLKGEGYRVVVLSRGYGRRMRDGMMVVSDGRTIDAHPEEAGDEPVLLARRLGGVPVVVGKDRSGVGEWAVERWGCDVLVLDDGF